MMKREKRLCFCSILEKKELLPHKRGQAAFREMAFHNILMDVFIVFHNPSTLPLKPSHTSRTKAANPSAAPSQVPGHALGKIIPSNTFKEDILFWFFPLSHVHYGHLSPGHPSQKAGKPPSHFARPVGALAGSTYPPQLPPLVP